jgi:hypothetical protein
MERRTGHPWTHDEVRAIMNMDGTESDKDLGARIGRSVKAIHCKRDKERNARPDTRDRRKFGSRSVSRVALVFNLVDTEEL